MPPSGSRQGAQPATLPARGASQAAAATAATAATAASASSTSALAETSASGSSPTPTPTARTAAQAPTSALTTTTALAAEAAQTPSPSPPPLRPRPRPVVSEQVRVIRDLWLLREQARVQAAERHFLNELQALLSRTLANIAAAEPQTTRRLHPGREWERRVAERQPRDRPAFDTLNRGNDDETSTGTVDSGSTISTSITDNVVITYESNPPPRDEENAPVRERHGHVYEEVQELRQQQRVTNLSPEFRAILEGHGPPEDERRGLVRTRSWGDDLMDQRAVSGALESAFRHELEAMLVQRGPRRGPRHTQTLERSGGGVQVATSNVDNDNPRDMSDVEGQVLGIGQHGNDNPSLEGAVRALREEVAVLKNVIGASFDMQLDIQRAIRQEVSAAMNREPIRIPNTNSAELSAQVGSTGSSHQVTADGSSRDRSLLAQNPNDYKPAVAGTCIVCLESRVDAMLYSCGHMCSCAMCGRHLVASGQSCPICRAPIRDVVRVYMVAED